MPVKTTAALPNAGIRGGTSPGAKWLIDHDGFPGTKLQHTVLGENGCSAQLIQPIYSSNV